MTQCFVVKQLFTWKQIELDYLCRATKGWAVANIKDVLDMIVSVVTIVGFLGVGLGWYISHRDAKQKGTVAMEQINLMATNHFPHMESDLKAQTGKLGEIHETQSKQIDVLQNIDSNIKVLVDRGVRL